MSNSAPANSGPGEGSIVAGVDIGDPELAAALRSDLASVEDLLVSRIESGEKFVSDIALHLVKAGGKRGLDNVSGRAVMLVLGVARTGRVNVQINCPEARRSSH